MHADTVVRAGRPADAPMLAALATQVFLHTYATRGVSAVIAARVLAEFTPPSNFPAWLFTVVFALGTAQLLLGRESHPNHVLVASDAPQATHIEG